MSASGVSEQPDQVQHTLGPRLRAARLARGLTQERLAEGIASKSFVSQVEKGQAQPSVATLVALAKRLGVSVGELVGEELGERADERPGDWEVKTQVTPLPPAWMIEQIESALIGLAGESPGQTCPRCRRALGIVLRVLGKAYEVAGEVDKALEAYRRATEELLRGPGSAR